MRQIPVISLHLLRRLHSVPVVVYSCTLRFRIRLSTSAATGEALYSCPYPDLPTTPGALITQPGKDGLGLYEYLMGLFKDI